MKRLIVAALVMMMAGPVYAESEYDVKRLIDVMDAIGVSTVYDSKLCKDVDAYGMYDRKNLVVHVCNKGDDAEQLNTFKHEAWHVVQDYKDCEVGNFIGGPLMARTQIEKRYWSLVSVYPSDVHHIEADAYRAADKLSTRQIADLLLLKIRACNS